MLLIVAGLVAMNLGVDWAAWVAAVGVVLLAVFNFTSGDFGLGD